MGEWFWLSDAQMRGDFSRCCASWRQPRVDDRRVISGILHRYWEGLRWRTIPAECGPRTTLSNRWNRWSEEASGRRCSRRWPGAATRRNFAMVDSTAVRAHRSAAGAKGGQHRQAIGRIAGRSEDQDPRARRR